MGHLSIVFGKIVCPLWRKEDPFATHRHNVQIFRDQRNFHEGYPWITSRMFAVPDPEIDHLYVEQVISFGSSYKSIEDEWPLWISRFEGLLQKLCFSDAVVYLETELVGDHRCKWEKDIFDSGTTTLEELILTPIRFVDGPRNFRRS